MARKKTTAKDRRKATTIGRGSRRAAAARPSPRKKTTRVAPRRAPGKKARPRPRVDPLLAPIPGAEHRDLGHVQLDVVRTGEARVKRLVYPPGFRWSVDMKPVTGTDACMHAHVGFLARGEIHIEYTDGGIVEYKAPSMVAIAPGHDGWVVGREPVVLIEFDFERDTVQRLGLGAQGHR